MDILRQLLAMHVTLANAQERAQVAELAHQVQQVRGQTGKVAFADQGYAGEEAAQAARDEGIELQVIKLQEAQKAFVLLPPGGGWSSVALAGSTVPPPPRAGLVNAYPNPLPDSILSSSPCSCSFVDCRYFKVSNWL